jgi:protein-S-isoprenylcysteine O-methyltransferase Ste14
MIFRWLGGAVFVGSLALTVWLYAVPLGRVTIFGGWTPVAWNTLLFSFFALHHSALARFGAKRAMLRVVPEPLLRSVYVWVASLLLTLVCLFWQQVGGVVVQVTGPLAIVNAIVQVAGLVLIAMAVHSIDPLELAGIRQSAGRQRLQITGPYRLVRHPLYLGWVLIFFGAARMTGDRLAFAVISSAYLAMAVPWEERSLLREFGDAYTRYQRQVRWRIVPYLY